MPLVTVPKCDVFGVFKAEIKRYRVTVEIIDDEGNVLAKPFTWEKYLCRRAWDRAYRFIIDALTTPSKKKPEQAAESPS